MNNRAVGADDMPDRTPGRHVGIAGEVTIGNHPVPKGIGVLRSEPVAKGVAIAAKLRRPRFDPHLPRIGIETEVVAANGVILATAP